MMTFIHESRLFCVRGAAVAVFVVSCVRGHAACVDPQKPAVSPSEAVEVFFNIHLPERQLATAFGNIVSVEHTYSDSRYLPEKIAIVNYGLPTVFGRGAGGYTEEIDNKIPYDDIEGAGHGVGDGFGTVDEHSDGSPPYVWPNHVDPVKFDQKKLKPEGGSVYFYEPDGKGGRRVCRMERWLSRTLEITAHGPVIARKKPVNLVTSSDQTRNPVLAALSKDYFFIGYSNLRYDARGMIPQIGPVCFYYKDDGQVNWIGYESPDGKCHGEKPDPKKEAFIEVLFDAKGMGYGSVLTRPLAPGEDRARTQGDAKSDGKSDVEGWFQTWFFSYGGGKVAGYADDRVGLESVSIRGSLGAKDDTVYNEIGKGEKSRFSMGRNETYRNYEFPLVVPSDLLRNPEALYQVERVRVTGSSPRLFERFAAGSSKVVSRLWSVGMERIVRQDILKDGQVVRAVMADNLKPGEAASHWIEDWEKYRSQVKVPFDNVYLRVYDYDEKGVESLVAIGWTDYPRAEYYARTRGSRRDKLELFTDKANKLLHLKPDVRGKMPDQLTYYFGTPNGKVKWKNFDAMAKELGPFQAEGLDVIFPTGRRAGKAY